MRVGIANLHRPGRVCDARRVHRRWRGWRRPACGHTCVVPAPMEAASAISAGPRRAPAGSTRSPARASAARGTMFSPGAQRLAGAGRDCVVPLQLDMLQHADGVRARGHGRARHNLDRLAGLEGGAGPLLAGANRPDAVASAVHCRVPRGHGVAVAGGAVERWLVAVRHARAARGRVPGAGVERPRAGAEPRGRTAPRVLGHHAVQRRRHRTAKGWACVRTRWRCSWGYGSRSRTSIARGATGCGLSHAPCGRPRGRQRVALEYCPAECPDA